MDKPITVAIAECKQSIAETINNSNLPLCILDYIVRDIYNEIHILSEKQTKEDIEKYKEKSQKSDDKK